MIPRRWRPLSWAVYRSERVHRAVFRAYSRHNRLATFVMRRVSNTPGIGRYARRGRSA